MRLLRTGVFALTVVVYLTGCRATTPSPATPCNVTAAQETAGSCASGLANDLHWSRNSAEHRALLLQLYRRAGEVLAARVADLEPGTWAVALDADETVIDNSLYFREQAKCGEGRFDRWGAWVRRQEAMPLPGAVGFLNQVHEMGGKIAIVTNRGPTRCPHTEENFKKVSIPFDVMLCRQNGKSKEGRWRQIEEGKTPAGLPPLKIMMWLGDNITDFPGLDQEVRNQPDAAFERFGVEYFLLPNPMYGSWTDNPPN